MVLKASMSATQCSRRVALRCTAQTQASMPYIHDGVGVCNLVLHIMIGDYPNLQGYPYK